MKKTLKLATVFSGIGSIEHAIEQLGVDNEIIFACDNGEREIPHSKEQVMSFAKVNSLSNKEFNQYVKSLYEATGKINYVKQSYFANYPITEDNWYEDVRFIDGTNYRGEVDLFVGGSPCQSFSISGKRAGLQDARGTLFYEFARLVDEIKPKVFIYENVPGLLNHDGGNTFRIITEIFDSLGYDWKYEKLNAKDFGIPQNRCRVFVVGFRKDLGISNYSFPIKEKLTTTVKDFLEIEPEKKYFLGEKGFKWCTSKKSLMKRVSINKPIARTQAANQQFNWCGDKVFYPIEEQSWARKDKEVYVGKFEGVEGVLRKLTPRECLRLMGYDDSFKIIVNDQQMYRQTGNSIVVNCMRALVEQIIRTGVFND